MNNWINNIELYENLDLLGQEIMKFIDFVEENEETNEDGEFEFLEDHSNISNTDIDNLVESLYDIHESIEKLK